jgi:TonB family protein
MKNLFTLIILAACSYSTPGFAQVKNLLYTDVIYTQVDKYPVYTGGFKALHDFLNKNLKTGGETGRVIATFVVRQDGSVSNVEVVRSFSDKASAEALRVINLMPKWKPGIKNGRVVSTQFTIPISFQKQ